MLFSVYFDLRSFSTCKPITSAQLGEKEGTGQHNCW